MPVSGRGWLVAGADLGPSVGFDVVLVEVISPVHPVVASEDEHKVVEGDTGVKGSLKKV